ncbi:phospholipase A1 PLIP1, chloroplastic [Gossypium arboreum]|uniref:phospholipase A1 PLIP1, chloroplastic n=1 Tax=Gossypium arboreum TaxID=29729 RepID=UPI000819325E|nr:phospholipase A1 PLIP1, chloroplastic [Gossypium arboreum]
MACASMAVPTSRVASKAKEEEINGLRRLDSSMNKAGIRRSYSDNHLCCSINRIRAAASTKPTMTKSSSVGILPSLLPVQISSSIIPNSVRSFLFDDNDDEEEEIKRANWVNRLLEVHSRWKHRQIEDGVEGGEIYDENENDGNEDEHEGGCEVNYNSDEEGDEVVYDRESFSKLLVRVPLSDTKLFSELAFLCNIAYVIPKIEGMELRKYYGLKFVTSSIEKKAEVATIKAKMDQDSIRVPVATPKSTELEKVKGTETKRLISLSAVYEIAASAAYYVQSRAKGLLSPGFKSPVEDERDSRRSGDEHEMEGENSPRVYNSEVAAYMAASAMTAVVRSGEKEKQETAKDLQSLQSSPCEWFVCDELSTYTRCFVIQGSDSLASWQANLLFEPSTFEDTDVLVHRGIYEAAKGIYEQFLPEIMDHLNRHGDRAKLQFTGHSLGGSLSLLVSLMLLAKKVVKPSALRPVVTFGSPFVFCGGQKILEEFGLDDNHVHCVMMHRDIVPRAFSCKYPNHVAIVLKRLPGSLRSHRCLLKNKLLYTPLGKLFIVQPSEKSSPPHPLLPLGTALYELDKTHNGYSTKALKAFLNCPHPLDTLSDLTAYGSEGTILRDHDSSNYLKAINGVLRQHKKTVPSLTTRTVSDTSLLWPLLVSPSPRTWNHHRQMMFSNKEIMTGV